LTEEFLHFIATLLNIETQLDNMKSTDAKHEVNLCYECSFSTGLRFHIVNVNLPLAYVFML